MENIDIWDYSRLDTDELPQYPISILGGMNSWLASKLWNLNYFKIALGKVEVKITRSLGKDESLTTLENYINSFEKVVSNPYYLDNWIFQKDFPSLKDQYQVHEKFTSWLDKLHPDIKPILSWIFIGAENSVSSLHQDMNSTSAWNALFSGKKLWVFCSPHECENLYDGKVDIIQPDFDKYPLLKKIKFYHIYQNPGEIVFVPSGWWHQVLNLTPTISLTENFVNLSNYQLVRDHVVKDENIFWMQIMKKMTTYFVTENNN